jgi:hypothetical protein
MNERGVALAEALIVSLIVGLIWAAAAGVLAEVPAQAARWEEAAAMRQRMRVIEARVGKMAASAAAIAVEVDGRVVRIPSVWPRRLGALRAGAPGEVSATDVTFLSRIHGQRVLTLAAPLAGGGGEVGVTPQGGCGSAVACGLVAGDSVLVVARDGACGLYRVEAIGPRLRLAALMPPGAATFAARSAVLAVTVDAVSFSLGEAAIRRYDGYRSDNVLVDGVRDLAIDWMRPGRSLGDGPFIGSGALAYDHDQLAIEGVRMTVDLIEAPGAGLTRRVTLRWRSRGWP